MSKAPEIITPPPLLVIASHHPASAETPRLMDFGNQSVYTGYFANRYGEQWVFRYDRRTRAATLTGGDIDWKRVEVSVIKIPEAMRPKVLAADPGMNWIGNILLGHEKIFFLGCQTLLSPAELLWLKACWLAATGTYDQLYDDPQGPESIRDMILAKDNPDSIVAALESEGNAVNPE